MHRLLSVLPQNQQEELSELLCGTLDPGVLSAALEERDFWEKLLPETAPSDWLPWLFYALGGEDYQHPAMDETWKRKVLARLFDLYKHKGTITGTQLHIDLLSYGTFLAEHHAPAKSFCGSSLTDDQRLVFESKMRKVRAYPYRHRGFLWGVAAGQFPGDSEDCTEEGTWKAFPTLSDALLRAGEYVELYDPVTDEATALNYFQLDSEEVEREAQSVVEVRKKGLNRGPWCGGFVHGCICDNGASTRLYRLILEETYTDIVTRRHPVSIRPGLTPVRTYYELEAVQAPRNGGLFLGNKWKDVLPDKWFQHAGHKTYTVDTRPDLRVRKVLTLFEQDRVTYPERTARFFLGGYRVGGLAAHHAELMVDVRRPRKKGAVYPRGRCFLSRKHLPPSDALERVRMVLWAAKKARRGGEKVLLSHFNSRQITSSSSVTCGAHVCGEYYQTTV